MSELGHSSSEIPHDEHKQLSNLIKDEGKDNSEENQLHFPEINAKTRLKDKNELESFNDKLLQSNQNEESKLQDDQQNEDNLTTTNRFIPRSNSLEEQDFLDRSPPDFELAKIHGNALYFKNMKKAYIKFGEHDDPEEF